MSEGVSTGDVDNLVHALRTHADAKAIKRELYAGLNRASKPLRQRMIDAIPEALPRSGGLAEQMQSKVSSRASAKGGKWAGVSIRFSSKGYDMRTLTSGRIRHPVYGNRGAWVEQTAGVNPDAFSDEFSDEAPRLEREIVEVLEDIARKIVGAV